MCLDIFFFLSLRSSKGSRILSLRPTVYAASRTANEVSGWLCPEPLISWNMACDPVLEMPNISLN